MIEKHLIAFFAMLPSLDFTILLLALLRFLNP
jgi:hypothetical protein